MCRQVLVKFPITKFHKNPFFGTEVIVKRRTDRYDETNKHISTNFISNAPTTNTLSRRRHVVERNTVFNRSKLCNKSEDKQTQSKFLQEPQRSPTPNPVWLWTMAALFTATHWKFILLHWRTETPATSCARICSLFEAVIHKRSTPISVFKGVTQLRRQLAHVAL